MEKQKIYTWSGNRLAFFKIEYLFSPLDGSCVAFKNIQTHVFSFDRCQKKLTSVFSSITANLELLVCSNCCLLFLVPTNRVFFISIVVHYVMVPSSEETCWFLQRRGYPEERHNLNMLLLGKEKVSTGLPHIT